MIDTLFNIGFKSFFAFIGIVVVIVAIFIILALFLIPLGFLPDVSKLDKDSKKIIKIFIGVIFYFILLKMKESFELSSILFGLYCGYVFELHRNKTLVNLKATVKPLVEKVVKWLVVIYVVFMILGIILAVVF